MTEQRWSRLFSLKLQELMMERGMTELSLSATSGLGHPAISKYIHGLRIPGAMSVIKLAYALGVSTDELINFGETIDDGDIKDLFYADFESRF